MSTKIYVAVDDRRRWMEFVDPHQRKMLEHDEMNQLMINQQPLENLSETTIINGGDKPGKIRC